MNEIEAWGLCKVTTHLELEDLMADETERQCREARKNRGHR